MASSDLISSTMVVPQPLSSPPTSRLLLPSASSYLISLPRLLLLPYTFFLSSCSSLFSLTPPTHQICLNLQPFKLLPLVKTLNPRSNPQASTPVHCLVRIYCGQKSKHVTFFLLFLGGFLTSTHCCRLGADYLDSHIQEGRKSYSLPPSKIVYRLHFSSIRAKYLIRSRIPNITGRYPT